MKDKKQFLTLMNMELDRLISMYESTIKKQKEEIEQLTLRLEKSEDEKEELQKALKAKAIKKEAPVETPLPTKANEKTNFNPSCTQIDEIISSNSIEEMQSLLSAAKRMWRRMDIEKLTYVFEKLNDHPRLLKFHYVVINNDALSLINSVLLKKDVIEQEHDQLVNEVINLGLSLYDAPIAAKIALFLQRKNGVVFENIVSRNEPSIIIKYLRMLMNYKCETEVKEALKHLLNIEWGFIDASLKKEEFEFFLWYAYLFGLDEELIDKSEVSLKWFKETSKELAFYFYFSEEKYLNSQRYKFNANQFMSGKVLTSSEKNLILEKVKKEHEIKSETVPKVSANQQPIHIFNKNDFIALNKQYELVKQRTSLPLYQKNNIHQIYLYIETDNVFISRKNGMAFLYREDYEKLLKENAPLVIKTGQVNYVTRNTKLIKEEEETSFAWPSTEVKTSESEANNEEKVLNETSELKRMGYQITGVSRAQRWKALERAVPQLGLKKVVHTISYNVKLRKGQKNGVKKFSYAISEWEHDLANLKKHYYKQDFKWPDTL